MARGVRTTLLLTSLAVGQLLTAGFAVAAPMRPDLSAALPTGLNFGIANAPSDLGWMTSSGVPWAYRYQYLSAGVNTGSGWETWDTPTGQFATNYMTASRGAGYLPVFTYYELLQSSPATGASESDKDFSNLNNASTMNAYYANFALLMQKAGAFGGTVIVHIEPDLWGYLEQRAAGGSAASLPAMVKSSGFADAAGINDTVQGFAGALLHLRDKYAPNALLATHASLWGSGYDIATNTDPGHEADLVAAFLNSAGVAANPWGSTFDLVFNDVDDHDAGWWELVAHDSAHWWDPQNLKLPNFSAWLSWMTELHAQTARPLVEWQVPLGNQYFLTENNTDGHYQDNRAAYFIAHVPALQAAGIQAVLFGAGISSQTTNTDAKGDGTTNNNGAPTSDLAGACSGCNTHVSQYADDDGGYLRIFVGQFYNTSPAPIDHLSAVSTQQYQQVSSDGATWRDLDAAKLSLTLAPTQPSVAIISGNADLWTATAGVNQDLGIYLSPSAATGGIVAWKESGGFAGTFSPNAAAVETVVSLNAGITYTVKLDWKTNRPAPGATIFAGAGPWPAGTASFSPTRLTAIVVPVSSATVQSAASTSQYRLVNSDGATWTDLDSSSSTPLTLTVTPGSDSMAVISANADLWTANAGYNQDLGINVAEASTGQYPGQIIAWKESGGNAGTFSPNAAYVQGVISMTHGQTYHVKLQWKTNRTTGGQGAAIYAGAGPWPSTTTTFSPSRLTVQLIPTATTFATAATRAQLSLAGSDGSSWRDLSSGGTSPLVLSLSSTMNCVALIGGNADLWTANAGVNQDLGISISPSTATGNIVAWKESGGFAGTFSPNAAFVQVAYPVTANTVYTIKLVWKTNKPSATSTIFAGAGPWPAGGTLFSPTRLTAQLVSCG